MMNLLFLIGGGLVVFLIMVGAVFSIAGERSLVEERLGPYLRQEAADRGKDKNTPVGDWINKKVEHSGWGSGMARELARADLKLKPAEYVSLIVIVGFGVGVVSWFFGGRSIPSALLGVLVGVSLPRIYVRRQQGKRLIRFNEQLADMLNLMVNGLRAGYSTMQGMEAVSKERDAMKAKADELTKKVDELTAKNDEMSKKLAALEKKAPAKKPGRPDPERLAVWFDRFRDAA